MPVTNLDSATWFVWVHGFSFLLCCRRASCRMLEPTCRSSPPHKPGSKRDALTLSCPVPPEPLTSLLCSVRLRADGALTNTDYTKYSLPLYDRLYYCSCALAHGFNDFSIILSIPSLLTALSDWFLALVLNYTTFFCSKLHYTVLQADIYHLLAQSH